MNKYEQDILAHIDQYGCSVTSVVDPEGKAPSFSYSIGIARSAQAPEIIILGLGAKLGHSLINEYNRRVRSGERFEIGQRYEGFLEGFAVQFGAVDRASREKYMLSAVWLHKGSDFEAVQMIYPDTSGIWPWDAEADAAFLADQPLLAGTAAP